MFGLFSYFRAKSDITFMLSDPDFLYGDEIPCVSQVVFEI